MFLSEEKKIPIRGNLMMRKKIFLILVLVVLAQIPLLAATTGKIAGKVTDQDGNPVPFASVFFEGTEIGTQTKENGTYTIINVPPGTYNLICQRSGFQPRKITDVEINLDLTTIQNFEITKTALKIDDFEVTEAKNEMVQRNKTSSGRTIKAADMEEVAVDDIEDVIAIQSGVTQTGGELHVRGGREGEVSYTIDGMSVTDVVDGGSPLTVDMDAVEVTDVQTGGFTAEYGNAQSGVINIVTKSGTRDYSGKLEMISDHVISDENSANNDILKINLGGPVLTPMVSSLRDRFTFFFNMTGDWSDSRYKDQYVNDPFEELKYLVTDEFDASDPFADRDDLAGFDLGDRNFNNYDANLKIKYQFNPKQKLTLSIRGDKNRFKSFAYNWKYALDHYQAGESAQNQFAGTYDHTFNPQTNLKLKLSYYEKNLEQGPDGIERNDFYVKNENNFDFYAENSSENITGIDYLTRNGVLSEYELYDWSYYYNNYQKTDEINDFVKPGSISGYYADDENNVMTFRTDLEYQLNQIHNFKTGLEITRNYIRKDRWYSPWVIDQTRYDSYLEDYADPVEYAYSIDDSIQFFSEPLNPSPESQDTVLIRKLYDLDDYFNAVKAASGYTDGYEAYPWQGAYYIQDKMEWEGMIVNAGLRFDFWYIGEKYKILQDAGNYTWEEFDDDDKFQMMLSPRLGVSHPISETAKIHFAYNYQNQLPLMQYIFTTDRPEDAVTSNTNVIVGKPDLEPQVTVTYEVGLEKQLSEDYVMDIQAYYKNTYNYVSTRLVESDTDDNVTWYEYYSNDYGSARGIDINLEKKLSNFIMGSTSYSLSWANGNNSDTVVQDYQTNLREFPLDWDIRHNYSLNLTFRIGKGEEFYLPYTDIMLPTFITDDFSTNLYYNIASGKPYTPATEEGTSMDTNSDRQPYTANTNMKISKKVHISEKLYMRAYLKINNLFDKKNVNWVYPITGEPDQDGVDISEPNSDYVPAEKQFIHDLATNNPGAYSQGRTFILGVSFNF